MTGRPKDAIITAPVAELLDPEIHTPPKGVQLLVVTRGGVIIKAPWASDCIAWGYLPKLPESVKARQLAKAEALLVRDQVQT
jgi:hypothetical protein